MRLSLPQAIKFVIKLTNIKVTAHPKIEPGIKSNLYILIEEVSSDQLQILEAYNIHTCVASQYSLTIFKCA